MIYIAVLGLVLLCGLLTGYAKLTLLQHYPVERYLDAGRPRRLYWTARAASVCTGLAVFGFGLLTRTAWVAVPAFLFLTFTVWVNVRAIRMRFSGAYRQWYAERRFG
ncbi:MAG TPA: hypothetical protein VFL13_09745 [Candidatus Baltobacteraceae bacterium]|nr:hypothetical protein [Candidatus Baltobacteraceae bacterium]